VPTRFELLTKLVDIFEAQCFNLLFNMWPVIEFHSISGDGNCTIHDHSSDNVQLTSKEKSHHEGKPEKIGKFTVNLRHMS